MSNFSWIDCVHCQGECNGFGCELVDDGIIWFQNSLFTNIESEVSSAVILYPSESSHPIWQHVQLCIVQALKPIVLLNSDKCDVPWRFRIIISMTLAKWLEPNSESVGIKWLPIIYILNDIPIVIAWHSKPTQRNDNFSSFHQRTTYPIP